MKLLHIHGEVCWWWSDHPRWCAACGIWVGGWYGWYEHRNHVLALPKWAAR